MASILRISSSLSPCSSSSSSSACASASASAVSFAWLSRQSSCFRRRHSRCLCSGISVDNTSTVNSQTVKERTSGTSIPKFQKRLRISDILNRPNDALSSFGHRLCIRGWVRTCRVQKTITFIEINDGSCLSNLQCVVNSTSEGYDKVESGLVTTGAAVSVEGNLVFSEGTKQRVELKVTQILLIGGSDSATYPMQKKKASMEYMRSVAHMRPRTNTFGAVTRVRNALAYATHKFFQEMGFVWVASPIVTTSDCEGSGEQFCVTTLLPPFKDGLGSPVELIPCTEDGMINWSQDFFGKQAFLTVSGQLNAETYACSFCDVPSRFIPLDLPFEQKTPILHAI